MVTRNLLVSLLAIVALTTGLIAQVPPGQGLRFTIGTDAPGIEIIDLVGGTGDATIITGLLGVLRKLNGGIIDPVTGDIYAVGDDDSGTAGLLVRIELDGTGE